MGLSCSDARFQARRACRRSCRSSRRDGRRGGRFFFEWQFGAGGDFSGRTLVRSAGDTASQAQQVEPARVPSTAKNEREMSPAAAPASRVVNTAAGEKRKDLIAERSAGIAATEEAPAADASAASRVASTASKHKGFGERSARIPAAEEAPPATDATQSGKDTATASKWSGTEKKVVKKRSRRPSRVEQAYAEYGSSKDRLEIMPLHSYALPPHSYALRAPYPYDGSYPRRAAYPPRAYSWGEYIWGAD
jgi:hypothetical protein